MKEFENRFEEFDKDIRRITNTYIDHLGEIDWEDFIKVLKKLPGTLEVIMEDSNNQPELKQDRVWKESYKDDSIEEPSYTRLKIKSLRGGHYKSGFEGLEFKMETAIKIKLYGLLCMISEDYSGNCTPDLGCSCPLTEWTDDYIIIYYEWHNHYGS